MQIIDCVDYDGNHMFFLAQAIERVRMVGVNIVIESPNEKFGYIRCKNRTEVEARFLEIRRDILNTKG